ncbi:hypothetical protein NDU88_004998 [Pleurodeles waltl]|uniref:Uncharacterized protein n=1 Tax=Pleurodeles waltl TaxID=8319 RepID=A0AAV7WZX0_PLEWA|nr:hypothetical protein NDU88_004998 [Pleurodeles waltl]
METRCTTLEVLVAKQKSRQNPKISSAVQVRALVRKENCDPYTWDGTVSDNDWNCEDEVEAHVAELDAEVTLINGNPKRLPGKSVIINGYGGVEAEAKPVKLKLSIGKGPPFSPEVLIAEVPEYIIGMDLLLGKTTDTQWGTFTFDVRSVHMKKSMTVLIGHEKWSPLHVPPPKEPVYIKQYRIPGGHKEISETIQRLLDAGVLRPAVSPFKSPIWPVKKPDDTHRMTVDY